MNECLQCKRIFQYKRSDQKYCSEDCRIESLAPKRKVSNLLKYAVKKGDMQRKPCVICGKTRVHGHHKDYSKPYEVVWLCAKHHAQVRLLNV